MKKRVFVFICIVVIVAVGTISGVILLKDTPSEPDKKISSPEDIKLSGEFKKEIIINSKNYLKSNNVKLEDLKDGEELKIDSKKIVTNEEYNKCSGNLVIKRYNDSYTYSPEITCGEQPGDQKIEYHIFDGFIKDITYYGDNTLVESYGNWSLLNDFEPIYDDTLMYFDASGNVLWSYQIKRQMDNGKSQIKGMKVFDDKFFIVVEYTNDIVVEEHNADGSGQTSARNSYELLVLDKNGKNITKKYKEANKTIKELGGFEYLSNNKIYFNKYNMNGNNQYYELDLETMKFEIYDIPNFNTENGYVVFAVIDAKMYLDLDDGVLSVYDLKKEKFGNEFKTPEKAMVSDVNEINNLLYIYYSEEEDLGDNFVKYHEHILVVDKDFNKVSNTETDSYDYVYNRRMLVNNDKVYVETSNFEDETNKLYIFDLEGNYIKNEVINDVPDLDKEFSYLSDYYYTSEGLNMIYQNKKSNEQKDYANRQILFITMR